MAKYKIMLLYAFLFFSVSMSLIILGSNLTYEVVVGRQEQRPSFVKKEDKWVVQKATKGVPPVKIVTQTEWRQGTEKDYQATWTRQIHWTTIVGVICFSIFMSGLLVFMGAAILVVVTGSKFYRSMLLHRSRVSKPPTPGPGFGPGQK